MLDSAIALNDLAADAAAADCWPGLAHRRATGGIPPDIALLQQFKALMSDEGCGVQLARMCYDRLYAYERIAQAHSSASDALRRVALQLFQRYHDAGSSAGPQATAH